MSFYTSLLFLFQKVKHDGYFMCCFEEKYDQMSDVKSDEGQYKSLHNEGVELVVEQYVVAFTAYLVQTSLLETANCISFPRWSIFFYFIFYH